MTDNPSVHPLVNAALEAMKAGDRQAWLHLFSPEVMLIDDGTARDFVKWSDSEFFGRSTAYLKSIDRVEDNGLTLYGTFHSDRWGEFGTFMRFKIHENKIVRLDVGQA
jgi:hypothetical protein